MSSDAPVTTAPGHDAAGGAPVAPRAESGPGPAAQPSGSRRVKVPKRPGDLIFSGLAVGSAVFVSVLIAAIGLFLVGQAIPALSRNQVNFLTSRVWNVTNPDNMMFGVLDLVQVTVLVSLFALLLAMPIALGIAIFLTEYSPKFLKRPLAYAIDLLAAVPSVVYGIWGYLVLAPALRPVAQWLNNNLGWMFLFGGDSSRVAVGGTVFTAGIVLAVMILPVIAAVSREVFVQTPQSQIEAALSLGATRWEVVRTTILPFGKSGYLSGSMLGLGRALGETMALFLVLKSTPDIFQWSLFDQGSTIASQIANGSSEFENPIKAGAYIAAGLVLFVMTFVVNAAARAAISGKRS